MRQQHMGTWALSPWQLGKKSIRLLALFCAGQPAIISTNHIVQSLTAHCHVWWWARTNTSFILCLNGRCFLHWIRLETHRSSLSAHASLSVFIYFVIYIIVIIPWVRSLYHAWTYTGIHTSSPFYFSLWVGNNKHFFGESLYNFPI